MQGAARLFDRRLRVATRGLVSFWQTSKSMGYLIADNGDLDMVFPVIEGEVLRCAVGTGTRTISAPRKEFA